MILAEVHTDDCKCFAFFDATSFFEQAADVVCWVRADRPTSLPPIWDEIPGGTRQAGEAVEEWKPGFPVYGANVRS